MRKTGFIQRMRRLGRKLYVSAYSNLVSLTLTMREGGGARLGDVGHDRFDGVGCRWRGKG